MDGQLERVWELPCRSCERSVRISRFGSKNRNREYYTRKMNKKQQQKKNNGTIRKRVML